MKNSVINLSICLSDIPKNRIKVSDKNGKKYLNISVRGRKEPDQFDNDITAFISQTQDEREAKADKIYIGQGKHIEFTASDASPESVNNMPAYVPGADDDGLPF